MTVKQDLKKIILLDARINSKIRQLDRLRKQQTFIRSIDYTKDRVQSARYDYDSMIIKIIDLEETITRDIDFLIDLKKDASNQFVSLGQPYGIVMELRYLEGKRWMEIAVELDYSLQSIYRIHGEALILLNKMRVNESK